MEIDVFAMNETFEQLKYWPRPQLLGFSNSCATNCLCDPPLMPILWLHEKDQKLRNAIAESLNWKRFFTSAKFPFCTAFRSRVYEFLIRFSAVNLYWNCLGRWVFHFPWSLPPLGREKNLFSEKETQPIKCANKASMSFRLISFSQRLWNRRHLIQNFASPRRGVSAF